MSETWDKNISVRVTQLGLKHGEIADALGVSNQGWYAMRTAKNPTLRTMTTVGMILACPWHLLLEGDVGQVVAEKVPLWDWIGWIKKQQEAGRLAELSWDDVEREQYSGRRLRLRNPEPGLEPDDMRNFIQMVRAK